MKIVPISFRIQGLIDVYDDFTRNDGIALIRKCEYAGRISHRSEDRVTDDSYDKFIRSVVLGHGDFSIIEHASVTVEAELDRGLTHEVVRHRIGAYTQESTRFVNYGKQPMRFVQPAFKDKLHSAGEWIIQVGNIEQAYLRLLEAGEPPELARSVLPNSLASKIVMTYDLRMWRHFFIMRTCREAHPQMKEFTIPLLAKFQRVIPILYEDIEPNMKQSEAMKLLR